MQIKSLFDKLQHLSRGLISVDEPRSEETGLLDCRPGLTQTGLYIHKRKLQFWNFGCK